MAESDSQDFTMFEHRVTGLVYFVIGTVGVCANFVTFLIFWRQRPLSGNKNSLHIQQTLANIMIVIATPFSGSSAFSGKWLFGELGCKLYGLETYTGGIGALTFIIFLCVERYFATVCRESYKAMSTAAMTLVVLFGWLLSTAAAAGPLIGWNRYTLESSGTACGLDRHDGDSSIFMVLPLVTVVMAIIAILALWAAFNHEEMKSEAKKNEEEWFTENSLNWIALADFTIVMVGFAPYWLLSVWTVFNSGQKLSMLASVIPPIVSKASTIVYPIVYLVSSKPFREAYIAKTIGGSSEKKTL